MWYEFKLESSDTAKRDDAVGADVNEQTFHKLYNIIEEPGESLEKETW